MKSQLWWPKWNEKAVAPRGLGGFRDKVWRNWLETLILRPKSVFVRTAIFSYQKISVQRAEPCKAMLKTSDKYLQNCMCSTEHEKPGSVQTLHHCWICNHSHSLITSQGRRQQNHCSTSDFSTINFFLSFLILCWISQYPPCTIPFWG